MLLSNISYQEFLKALSHGAFCHWAVLGMKRFLQPSQETEPELGDDRCSDSESLADCWAQPKYIHCFKVIVGACLTQTFFCDLGLSLF